MKKLAYACAILLLSPLQASFAEFDDRNEKWAPDLIEAREDILLLPDTRETGILNPSKANDFAEKLASRKIHADSTCFLTHEKSRRLRKIPKGTKFKILEINKRDEAFKDLSESQAARLKQRFGEEIPKEIKTIRDANLFLKGKPGEYLLDETQYEIRLSRLKKAKPANKENDEKSAPEGASSESSGSIYCFLYDEAGFSLNADLDQIFRILAKYSPLIPLQNEDAEE